jgi:dephospho-CoA kinase
MKWVGLCGLIGSGKSTAGRLFAERGCAIIDVDVLNRELQQPGQELFDLIVAHFGPGIVATDGTMDRAALGAIVFNDKSKLAELTNLVAPITEQELVARGLAFQGTDTVVLAEAAMFVGKQYGLEATILVDVSPEIALERLVRDRGMTEDDAKARLASQVPRASRIEAADYVIDNSGTLTALAAEVDRALEWIRTSTADATPRVVRRADTVD